MCETSTRGKGGNPGIPVAGNKGGAPGGGRPGGSPAVTVTGGSIFFSFSFDMTDEEGGGHDAGTVLVGEPLKNEPGPDLNPDSPPNEPLKNPLFGLLK